MIVEKPQAKASDGTGLEYVHCEGCGRKLGSWHGPLVWRDIDDRKDVTVIGATTILIRCKCGTINAVR